MEAWVDEGGGEGEERVRRREEVLWSGEGGRQEGGVGK